MEKPISSWIMEVFRPTGSVQVTPLHAPRVADLNGKTICELSDYNWRWEMTFPVIRELLQRQFPTAKIIPWDQLGVPTREAMENLEHVAKMVKEKGCQAVIVGNAA